MKLTELTMLSLQTAYMQRDPTTQALCTALDGELKKTIEGIYNLFIFRALDKAGDTPFAHELVDELAWQFHCDYYDASADIETKKSIVKNSIKIHRTKGTPQAVEDLLKSAFPSDSVLYEWYQYNGEPYHFKIVTSSLNGVDTGKFIRALNSVKNARSYLDGIQLFEAIESAMVSRSESKSTIDYTMLVGDFVAYTFGGVETLAFGAKESEYSFKPATYTGLLYTLNSDGVSYSCSGLGIVTDTDIVIEREFYDVPVTSIAMGAFEDRIILTSVTIPDSVTSIGERAFTACSSLASVTIGDGVKSIGNFAFSNCTSITSLTIPNSVTSIGEQVFIGCTNLSSITIGDGVTTVGRFAFNGCSKLTAVYINNLESWCNIVLGTVNSNPLYYANNLYLNDVLVTDLVIPEGVTSIGNVVFYNCTSLVSVTIPKSVTAIGINAFVGCANLTDVYYKGTEEEWNAISKNVTGLENATIHYNS